MLGTAKCDGPELTGTAGPAICRPKRRNPGEGPQLRPRRCWKTGLPILDGRGTSLHPILMIRALDAVAGHGSCESKECQLKLRCTYGRDLNEASDFRRFRFPTRLFALPNRAAW